MPRPWKIIVCFALTGLLVAGICYAYAAFHDYTKPMSGFDSGFMIVSMIVCPTQLVFAFCIDCEVTGWDGLIMYSIIGVLNTVLYGLVGTAIAGMFEITRPRREGE